jgi:hypothetical protein
MEKEWGTNRYYQKFGVDRLRPHLKVIVAVLRLPALPQAEDGEAKSLSEEHGTGLQVGFLESDDDTVSSISL